MRNIPITALLSIALTVFVGAGCALPGRGLKDDRAINTPLMLSNLQGVWTYQDPDTGATQTLTLAGQGLGSLQVSNQDRPLTFHWMIEGHRLSMRYYKDAGRGFDWKVIEDECGYLLRGNVLELKRKKKTLLMRRAAPPAS